MYSVAVQSDYDLFVKGTLIMHMLSKLGLTSALLALTLPTFASTAPPPGINGFSDPGGFTLNANSGGPDNQSAATHGVPTILGGTLHLTTSQGMMEPDTFYGSENTSAYANQRHFIGQFYASFVYHYNGTNLQSFGPGNGFAFILQNDPRGLNALGGTGVGNGQQGDGGTIAPSAAVEFGLFTGFGQPRGTQLAFNGDPGTSGVFRVPGSVDLVSGDPIAVVLSYNGVTLSETLTDTITHATYNTSYATDLVSALGTAYPYVGFSGGTGAAVADQTITNFIFSNTVPAVPVNAGPNLVVTARASSADASGFRQISITVTNNGAKDADFVEITGITLNGAAPPSGDIHNTLPTIKNLLTPGASETKIVVYQPSAGTTRAILSVGGDYIDPTTGGLGHFGSSTRLALP
jgi:hypothetical protein